MRTSSAPALATDPAATLDLLMARAQAARRHDPQAALEWARQALAQCGADQPPADTAACLLLCGELQHDLSDYDSACTHAAQALAHYQNLQHSAGMADSHELLGKGHEKLGRSAQALAQHQAALQLSQQIGDGTRSSRSLLSLGILRYDQSDFPGAIALYLQSLELAQAAGDAYCQGRALGCLGNAFERMGEYARSLAYHQRCLQQFDEGSFPRERSFALNNAANVYIALGEHQQAIPFHEQSLALKRRLKDRWGEGTSLQNLGYSHLCLDRLTQAQECLEHSLAIVQDIGDREGICMARQCLGDLAAKRGRLDDAVASYQAGLAISTELGDRYNQVLLLLCLGKVLRQQQRGDDARQALNRALQLSEDIQTKRLAQQARNELAALCEEAGDLASALAHVREAYRMEREVFSEDLDGKLRGLRLHFELEKADKEKELHRLRHVELAQANLDLQQSNERLAQANQQKEKLLQALEKQKRQLQRQSTHDALTGLHNRRHFDQELARAFRAAKRYGHALSVVICDIDDFKKINDRYSHQMGDEVLRTIGRLLTRHSRKTDVVARYGGEEFALLLTNTPGEQAYATCDKIRLLVARHPWETLHPELKVTLSMGICDDLSPDHHEPLMAQADKRLYRAKHHGKNQVVFQA
ncbi:diguanylate cyclase (GGDEF) domain-containing protein [Burkholderiales bacterium JOSHI_001]|nr:diguanylate cyclase (GGDEF) domain-containing protein [Burkholderiales bacterium JOSHI_001]